MPEEKTYTYQEYLEIFAPNATRRRREEDEDLTPEELGDKLAREALQKVEAALSGYAARRVARETQNLPV